MGNMQNLIIRIAVNNKIYVFVINLPTFINSFTSDIQNIVKLILNSLL